MLVGYVLRRLIGAIPVLLGVSAVVFLAMQLVPGDIAKALLGPLATQETVAEFRHYLGLDQPIIVQYGNWLWRALHGDLGRSFSSNMPVADLLGIACATAPSFSPVPSCWPFPSASWSG